jgi:hypothetical protein
MSPRSRISFSVSKPSLGLHIGNVFELTSALFERCSTTSIDDDYPLLTLPAMDRSAAKRNHIHLANGVSSSQDNRAAIDQEA